MHSEQCEQISKQYILDYYEGGGCQLTQILCIKFTSFLNSLCTIALFTSFWVTCSIFSVTNECCALIYSVNCKPFYVQIENNFFFCMVYYCVSFDLLRDASNVFSFSHSHTNIHLIWIKLEETLSMFICLIIKFYFIKVADIFDKECSIMCNKYIKQVKSIICNNLKQILEHICKCNQK